MLNVSFSSTRSSIKIITEDGVVLVVFSESKITSLALESNEKSFSIRAVPTPNGMYT